MVDHLTAIRWIKPYAQKEQSKVATNQFRHTVLVVGRTPPLGPRIDADQQLDVRLLSWMNKFASLTK